MMSLQLPPSLVTAFLISDPTAQPQSSTIALCILSELRALMPTAVIALLAAKANRALPPKVAQEGEIDRVRDTIYPTQLGAFFGCLATLLFSPITGFSLIQYLK